MKIEEAIARYIGACLNQGLRPSAIQTIRKRLYRMFEPVLAEQVAILTAEQIDALRARLGRPGLPRAPLVGSMRELHFRTTRSFLFWCIEQQLLGVDPLAPRTVHHIGETVRRLREAAGLLRSELASQIGLSLQTLSRFESARAQLSREELLRLLQHPSMEYLPEEVRKAGLELGLGDNGVGKP